MNLFSSLQFPGGSVHIEPQTLYIKDLHHRCCWDKAKIFGVDQWRKRRSNEMLFVRVARKKLKGKKALLDLIL